MNRWFFTPQIKSWKHIYVIIINNTPFISLTYQIHITYIHSWFLHLYTTRYTLRWHHTYIHPSNNKNNMSTSPNVESTSPNVESTSSSSATNSATGSPRTSKIKFLCSHGGKILPGPTDGSLKYVGGETRVISVHRDITFNGIVIIFFNADILSCMHVNMLFRVFGDVLVVWIGCFYVIYKIWWSVNGCEGLWWNLWYYGSISLYDYCV